MTDLLPCPFCGGAGRLVQTRTVAGVCRAMGHAVSCEGCGATFPGSMYEGDARILWNRRKLAQEHPDHIEVMTREEWIKKRKPSKELLEWLDARAKE